MDDREQKAKERYARRWVRTHPDEAICILHEAGVLSGGAYYDETDGDDLDVSDEELTEFLRS